MNSDLNYLNLKEQFPLIPDYQIGNLLECEASDLLNELSYCYWCISKGINPEYTIQVKELIEKYRINKNSLIYE